jgi:hypothetical protein
MTTPLGRLSREFSLFLAVLLAFTGVDCNPAVTQEQSASKTQAADKSEEDKATLDNIRRLISQLEADELAKRDEAEAELVKLGNVVLKFLPKVTPKTSGETKVRLQRIRQDLETAIVQSVLEASKLTLEGSFKLSEVLAKIKEQTGNIIQVQNGEEGGQVTITADWKDVSFWTAMDDLLRQSKMRLVALRTTENNLMLAAGSSNEQEAFHTGPFRVEPLGAASERTFSSPLEGYTRVSFLLSWEPRFEPLFMQIPMSSVKAVVGGNDVAVTNPQAAPEVRLNMGGSSSQVDIQLNRIAREHQKIDSLKGQLIVSLAGERHQYEFKKLAAGKRQSERFGDVSVTLEGIQRNGPVYEMRLLIEFGDSKGALESFRGWILSNEAYLMDAKDKKVENVGSESRRASENSVRVSYLFQLNGEPDSYRLIYDSPSSIRRQTIEYELKDFPLP